MIDAKHGAMRRLLLLTVLGASMAALALAAQPAGAATVQPTFNLASLADQYYTTTSTDGVDVTYTLPTASDDDGPVTVTCLPSLGHHFPIGESEVTCTATNVIGTSTASFDLHVVPPAGEVFWVGDYDDIDLEATGPFGATATWDLLDVFGDASAAFCAPAPGSSFTIGTHTVTCTAIGASLSDVKTFEVTVDDTTPPTITVPTDITVEATGPSGATVSFPAATAIDTVDLNPTVGCDETSGTVFPVGVTTVTCTATDDLGNSASDTFTITVQDTTAPTISGNPGTINLEATGPAGAVATFALTASDIVDGSVPVSCTPASGSTFAVGLTPVNCVATDGSGNSATSPFTVNVDDTTGPVFSGVPASFTQEQVPGTNTLQYTQPSASDLVDGPRPVQCLPPVGTIITAGPHLVTCQSWDTQSNMSQVTFTVTLADTTDPVVTVPADITTEATSAAGAAVSFSATAIDSLDGSITPVCTPASGWTFPIGTTGVSCTATDAAGNSSTENFNVTVKDTTGPVFSGVPADFSIEQTPGSTTLAYTQPTATDAVDGLRPVQCLPPVGMPLSPGNYTITCQSWDIRGNMSQVTFVVTIEDTTDPVIDNLPADQTLEATGPSGAVATFSGTATDNIDGVIALVCVPASGSTFPLGTTTVTCTATDFAGNVATDTFEVTVEDTTPPAFSNVPGTITEEATGPSGAAVTFTAPDADDIVDGAVTVTCDHNSGDTFPLGTTTVTCTATDAASNSDSVSFDIVVEDTTGPTLVDLPTDFSVSESTDVGGTTVTYTDPTATDLVDGATTVTCAPLSGTQFAVGTTTVTCESTDAASNTTTGTFVVTVVPRPAVAIASPVDGGSYQQGQFVTADYTCTADAGTTIDTCVGTVADDSVIDTTTPGPRSFTVTATDALGGVTAKTVAYTVLAPPAPVVAQAAPKPRFRILSASPRQRGRISVVVRVPGPGKLEYIATHVVSRGTASALKPGPGRFTYAKRTIRVKRSGKISVLLYPRNGVTDLLKGEDHPLLRLSVRYTPNGSRAADRRVKMVRP